MIWRDLLCCLSPREPPGERRAVEKRVEPQCVFCNPRPERFEIIKENDTYVVFKDRSPAAIHHLLAIPRRHIPNIQSLKGPEHISLVKDLQAIGRASLSSVVTKDEEDNEIRFGFHIPPFRSVDHVHMHCLVLPFSNMFKATKYRVAPGQPDARPPISKGWGWFVTASQAISILERNGEIKVGPC